MDTPSNDHRDQAVETRKGSIKRGLKDSAIASLIIPALSVIFAFAYNGGYNKYYGVPVFFSTASPIALLNNIPQLVFALCLTSYIVILLYTAGKIRAVPSEKYSKVSERKRGIIGSSIIFGVCIVLGVGGFLSHNLYFMILSVLSIATTAFNLVRAIRYNGRRKLIQADDREREKAQVFFELLRYIIIVITLGVGFISIYLYGASVAKNQEYYHVTDDSKAIINTYNDYAITVELINNDGVYSFERYELVPIGGLKFQLVHTGTISSVAKIPYPEFEAERIFIFP